MIFGLSRIDFEILLLKISMLSEFWAFQSIMFHSFIVQGKKGFLKSHVLSKVGEFLGKCLVLGEGTN